MAILAAANQICPILETTRLRLRRFCQDDLDRLEKIYSDVEVIQFLADNHPPSREETQKHLNNLVERYWCDHLFGRWAVIEKSSGHLIGYCGLRLLEGVPELVYLLARSHWGKGFATEGAREVLRYGFENRGLAEIVAITRPNHSASRHVMEKLGMRYIKTDLFLGLECVLYTIRRHEYRQRPNYHPDPQPRWSAKDAFQ